MKNTRKPNYKFEYNKLKTTEEKRLYVLSIIKDEKYIKLLKFKKISLSTIEIAFKLFIGEKIIIKPTNLNIFKEKRIY